MKTNNLGYWIPTVLLALVLVGGGFGQLTRSPELVASIVVHLGYPTYFMSITGVWKILGALALLAPGLPRLKEWAYAGIVFNMTGATFSHLSAGDPIGESLFPLALVALAFTSWWMRPASRKLAS